MNETCIHCGLDAVYKTKSGKSICRPFAQQCPALRARMSKIIKSQYDTGTRLPYRLGKHTNGWENMTDDARISAHKKSRKTLKHRIDSGEIVYRGKPHTTATKDLLSKRRIEFLKCNPHQNISWYNVTGIKVQGTWERDFAIRLNELSIKWTRKTLMFNGHRRYTPDFYLPDYNVYVEIKGFERDRDIYKMLLVLECNDIMIKYVTDIGMIRSFSTIEDLPTFSKTINDVDFSKFKNIWKNDAGVAKLVETQRS